MKISETLQQPITDHVILRISHVILRKTSRDMQTQTPDGTNHPARQWLGVVACEEVFQGSVEAGSRDTRAGLSLARARSRDHDSALLLAA